MTGKELENLILDKIKEQNEVEQIKILRYLSTALELCADKISSSLQSSKDNDWSYSGKENSETAQHLQAGETCYVVGVGNSMTPILKSKQAVIVSPVTEDTKLEKRDIVLAKVNGHYYLHLIHAIKNDTTFLIGNNHGHMNGWVGKNCIYGKVTKIL